MWFVNSEVGRIKQKIIICTACEVKVENSWKLMQAILGSKWRSKIERYEKIRPNVVGMSIEKM